MIPSSLKGHIRPEDLRTKSKHLNPIDNFLDLDLCHVCNSPTNNTNHICKNCKIFTPIIYLEKRYKLTAKDIYQAGNKHSNIFYPITKTTPSLWKNYFKKLENYN